MTFPFKNIRVRTHEHIHNAAYEFWRKLGESSDGHSVSTWTVSANVQRK